MSGQHKEKYRVIPILLLMKCIRPILREMLQTVINKKRPLQQRHDWSISEFLLHNRKQVERKVQKFEDSDNYISILYPTKLTTERETDIDKWDIKLLVFILVDICMIDPNSKYYLADVDTIAAHLSHPESTFTRHIYKEYKKRLRKARSRFYKLLDDDDVKRKVERKAKKIEDEKTNKSDMKDILKRWEKVENVPKVEGCKRKGLHRYLTINLLLSETCCDVMRAVVGHRVADLGFHSLDSFLLREKRRIVRRISELDTFGRPKDILFPRNGDTRLYDWDVTLLCWILLNVCHLRGIVKHEHPDTVADAIGKVREVRNKTVHKLFSSLNVSESEYESFLRDIKGSIETCLLYINDPDFSEDINNKIEEIERTAMSNDETIRRLQMCQRDRAEHELQSNYLQGQSSIVRELSSIVQKFAGVQIPACTLELVLNECSEDCEKKLSAILVDNINKLLMGNEKPDLDDTLKTALAQLIERCKQKGWRILSAENGSVLLHMQCTSFEDLANLYEIYGNKGSTLETGEIQKAVEQMSGTHVNVSLVMYTDEMDRCIENLVNNLLERTEHLIQRTNTSNKRIKLWLGFNEWKGVERSETCDMGTRELLENIADIFKNRYNIPSLSISSRFHGTNEDFNAQKETEPNEQSDSINTASPDRSEQEDIHNKEEEIEGNTVSNDETVQSGHICQTDRAEQSQYSKDMILQGENEDFSVQKKIEPNIQSESINTASPDRSGQDKSEDFNAQKETEPNEQSESDSINTAPPDRSEQEDIHNKEEEIEGNKISNDETVQSGQICQTDWAEQSQYSKDMILLGENEDFSVQKKIVPNRQSESINTASPDRSGQDISEDIHNKEEEIEELTRRSYFRWDLMGRLYKRQQVIKQSFDCDIHNKEEDIVKFLRRRKSKYDDIHNKEEEIEEFPKTLKTRDILKEILRKKEKQQLLQMTNIRRLKDYYLQRFRDPSFDVKYVPLDLEMKVSSEVHADCTGKIVDTQPQRFRLNYRDIFERGDHIYISGKTGMGKTTFCQKLVSDWCLAHSPLIDENNTENRPSEENGLYMTKFDMIFPISLSDTKEIFIENMITSQLGIQENILLKCLEKSRCLIILDGLDEWNISGTSSNTDRSEIPKMKSSNKCNLLITSRPWRIPKLPENGKIRVIEIKGISTENRHLMIKSILTPLMKAQDMYSTELLDERASKLLNEIQVIKYDDLFRIPLMLKALIRLWFHQNDGIQSRFILYPYLIDSMRINRIELENISTPLQTCQAQWQCKRICFNDTEVNLLTPILSKLAFQMSYAEIPSTSVMQYQCRNRWIVEAILKPEELINCFKVGILTRESNNSKFISFLHRSFQEYYAALHFNTNYIYCVDTLKRRTVSVEHALELSGFLIFLSGTNPMAMTEMAIHIKDLVDADERFQIVRFKGEHEQGERTKHRILVKNLSHMITDCTAESLTIIDTVNDFHVKLRDLYIDNESVQTVLTSFPHLSTSYLKSLHIDCDCSLTSTRENIQPIIEQTKDVVEMLHMSDITVFEKVFLHIKRMRSLKSLGLYNLDLKSHQVEQLLRSAPKLAWVILYNYESKKEYNAVVSCAGTPLTKCIKKKSSEEEFASHSSMIEDEDKYPELKELTLELLHKDFIRMKKILSSMRCCTSA